MIATGRTTSIRELCRLAFAHVGLDYEEHVRVDPRFLRPAEVDVLLGDASKAQAEARLDAGDEPRRHGRRDGRGRPGPAPRPARALSRRSAGAPRMTPQRILVTGAGGFVGRHLLPALAARFPAPTVLTPAFDVDRRRRR